MSQKDRTIQYLEGKIIEKLAKNEEISTDNLRNIEEEHNFDIALQLPLQKRNNKRKR